MPALESRSISMKDASWKTEYWNDPEVARYWWPYPRTEHEIKEYLKKDLDIHHEKYIIIIAEMDGDPVGNVGLGPETGRCQHSARN